MLFSGCVVLASLIYSAVRIGNLDKQVAERHLRLESLDREIGEMRRIKEQLQHEIVQLKTTNQQLHTTNQQLNTAISVVPGGELKSALAKSPQVTSKLPPLVYVQIANEGQRAIAEKASAKLRTAGYIVPGIENVGKKANIPESTEVRYFPPTKQDDPDLKRVVQALGQIGISANTTLVKLSSPPRQFELWFGKNA